VCIPINSASSGVNFVFISFHLMKIKIIVRTSVYNVYAGMSSALSKDKRAKY
jgi:hypothetical protein